MTTYADKRILTDIKTFKKGNLDEHGIYCHFNESNIKNVKALIIGPSDSPYEKGYYFFDINFPNNYPIEPPSVKFMTLDNIVRFNPNLYKNGKVCVSILGTWSGPGWTSCMNLVQVLLSIQSLLHDHPIQNEPGWENEKGQKSVEYNTLLTYYNYKIAIIKMITNTPYGFEEFKDIMKEHLLKNLDFHIEKLNILGKQNGRIVKSNIYSMYDTLNYNDVFEKLKGVYLDINKDLDKTLFERKPENILIPTKTSKSSTSNKKTPSRKVPNEPSTQFELGYKKVSENDGNTYEIVLRKDNKKMWKKIIV